MQSYQPSVLQPHSSTAVQCSMPESPTATIWCKSTWYPYTLAQGKPALSFSNKMTKWYKCTWQPYSLAQTSLHYLSLLPSVNESSQGTVCHWHCYSTVEMMCRGFAIIGKPCKIIKTNGIISFAYPLIAEWWCIVIRAGHRILQKLTKFRVESKWEKNSQKYFA